MLSGIRLFKFLSSTLIIGSFIGTGSYALNNSVKKDLVDNSHLESIHSKENLPTLEEKTIKNQVNEFANNSSSIDISRQEEILLEVSSKDVNLEVSKFSIPSIGNEYVGKENNQTKRKVQLEVIWIYGDSPGTNSKRKSCFSLKKGEEKIIPNIMEISDSSTEDEEEIFCERIIGAEDKYISGDQEGLWVNGNYEKIREMINSNLEDLKLSGFIKPERKNNFSSLERFNDYLESHCQLKEYEGNWIEISCLKEVKNVRSI